ncbi:YDG domain-containing protein, partial [Roseateles sp.]|uniref:YDG domain-containing protein n=1 Tax=Roseateles sp. TaxID=1971397 RepID=UPI002E04F55F|nr:YDG domain-containing protein [Roseateles sp.]
PSSGLHYVVPGVTALDAGRYVVASPWWSNGATNGVGAVTFAATGGIAGTVSAANSLVGATAGDHVGRSLSSYDPYTFGAQIDSGVVVLHSGGATHYMVRSVDWTSTYGNGGATPAAGAGAVTWVDGSNGHAYGESAVGAAVSDANSLTGSSAGDAVGGQSIALKRNVSGSLVETGDLLLLSNYAFCGVAGAGAITLFSGAHGAAGPVSWRNSLIGAASAADGLATTGFDGWSFTTDVRAAVLPAAVTSAEQVAWRPLVWVAPNVNSGNNASHAYGLTLLADSTAAPTTVDQVNGSGGNANWAGSLFAGNAAGLTSAGLSSGTLGFAANTGADVVITPAALTALLNAGTSVTLQANNDITVLRDVIASAGGAGGSLTLEAGRSIHLRANIGTDGGNFAAHANLSNGVVDADCSVCTAIITQKAGTTVSTGAGNAEFTIDESSSKTYNDAGTLRLASVDATQVLASNAGVDASNRGQGVRFQPGAVVGNSATEYLTLRARGTSALGGGLVVGTDTQLVGAPWAVMWASASLDSLAVTFGGSTSTGFAMTAGEMGQLIQHTSGFGGLIFGGGGQAGLTTVGDVDFTQASMQRGGGALDLGVVFETGSGGINLTGALKSGADADHGLELTSWGGNINLASTSSLVATSAGSLSLRAPSGGSITQASGSTLNANRVNLDSDGSIALSNGTNTIGTLTGQAGSLDLKTSGSLTVGVSGGSGLQVNTGAVIRTVGATADLTLDKPVSTNSGDLVLAAGRNFVNNNAVDTGLSVGTGRYLVYSATPSGTTEGMTGYGKHYAQTYSAGSTPGYAGSGSWFLYSTAPTLSVSVGAGATITYGDPGSVPGVAVTGFIDGDTLASATTGSLSVTTGSYTPSGAGFIPVGTYAVNLTGQGTFASSLGYQISVTTGSSNFVVNPKAINVSGLSAASKVYDGTTTAQVTGSASIASGGSTSGDGKALNGDVISISGTGSGAFADRHVGTAKSVTLSGLTLGGADAGNYIISAGSVQADITPKALTVGGLSVAASKVYDRGTAATVIGSGALLASEAGGAGSTADGKPYSGDTVSLTGSATATYDSSQVALASLVQFGGLTLTGAQAGDYTLSFGTQAAAITPKALTVTGTTVANKVYDGGVVAALSGGSLSGVVNGDTVTLIQAGHFADKNVGTAKAVTAADSLGGTDAGNYALTQPTSLAADITAKALTVTGTTVANKVYDGGTAATLTGGSLQGVINGDTVTLTETGHFADKNAGTAKAVTAADTLGGGDAGNYTVTQPTGLAADITPKALTVTGTTVADKVYDGGTAATLTGGSLQGVVNGDTVTLAQAGQFADKNVGTGKAVTAADTLSGADAGNYDLTQPTGLAAAITPKAITVIGTTVASKVYDGAIAAALSGGSLSGVVNGDTVTLTQAGHFADKNVGTAKAVTAADSLSGTDAGNYALTQPTSLAADITAKALIVTGTTVASKVYDGTAAATLGGGSLVGVVDGDTVTLTETGHFADKNAGTAKAVTAADTLGGSDAGNYSLVQPAALTGTVTPRTVTVTGTAVADKVYDGTTSATLVGGSLVGVLGGDAVTLVQAGDFADRNAGASKAVIAADALTGADAGNYSVSQPTGLSAAVSARTVTISGSVATGKVYDGTTLATVTGGSIVGLVGGDAVTLVQSGLFADKNVGTGKAVTVTGTLAGAAAGNYAVSQPTGLTADITPRALTVTGLQAQDKVYDGTLAAQVSAQGVQWQGLVAGDQVRVDSASGSFADKNAGVGKVVAVLASLGGVDLGNYAVTVQSQSSAAITPRGLTVTADDQHKVYGDADPTLTYRVGGQGLVAGDSVAGSFAGQLAADTGAQATAGSHAITLGTLSVDANYRITQFVPATLAVDKAPLTLTFNPQTKVYGAADPAATWSVDASQLKYGDGAGVVQLVSVSTAQGAQATAGTHAISGAATASNYQVSVRDGVLTVTQAPLTVTADDKTKTAGEQDPVLTWSLDASQLRYQDTAAVVQNASLSAPTGAGTPPGSYAIQVHGATAQNYALTLVDGVLTVKPSPAVKSENLQVQV